MALDRLARCGAALLLSSSFALFVSLDARAQVAGDGAAAEALVLAVYFEGLPYAEARAISAAGSERLVELLNEPAQARHHANIALALGIAARPGAYEALAAYAVAAAASGEITPAAYRTQRALPLAMGHLASRDDRAVAWLAARATLAAGDPGWSHRAMTGQRLARSLRRAAIVGLGLAARPEADTLLQQIASRAGAAPAAADGEAASQAVEALALSARIQNEGRAVVLGAQGVAR